MNQVLNVDKLPLDSLLQSEFQYQKNIKDIISVIKKDKNIEESLRKIILFCKGNLFVHNSPRKKFLCLLFIRDITENFKSELFERVLDEHIPSKIFKTITNQILSKQSTQSKNIHSDEEYSVKLLDIAIETVDFWSKKLAHHSRKSLFRSVQEQLKKLTLPALKNQYYKTENIINGLFNRQQQQKQIQFNRDEQISPLLSQIDDKFNDCTSILKEKLHISLQNEQQIFLKEIIQKLKDFLLLFFTRFKALQQQQSIHKDLVVIRFHIMNILYKAIANKIYISYYDMIKLIKQVFEANYSSDFDTINRMDIVNLAGTQKYNALSIFQRIHHRIELEEKKLGVCQIAIEEYQQREKQKEKQRERELVKKSSKEKIQQVSVRNDKFIRNSKGLLRK